MSAPSRRGCWKVGPRKVLSTITHGMVGVALDGLGGALDVGHDEGGVGRSFHEDDGAIAGGADGFVDGGGVAGRDGDAVHAEGLEKVVDQAGGAAVEGGGVDDGAAGAGEGEERGHDGGHAGVEDGGVGGAGLERDDLVFEDLGVGVGEARIDEVGALALGRLDLAVGNGEGVFGGFRGGKYVGRAAKDGGTGGAERKARVEAPGEDGGARPYGGMTGIASGHKTPS